MLSCINKIVQGKLVGKKTDLTGLQAGYWSIKERANAVGAHDVAYRCVCKCGREKIKFAHQLYRRGVPIAKGCKRCANPLTDKGDFFGWEKERDIWRDIISRCENKNDNGYKHYGARGIKVCSRWKNSFWDFVEDIGKIAAGMSIERVDNDGDYCPENCTLIPRREQPWNRRTTIWITIDGRKQQLFKWLQEYDMLRATYDKRVQRGMTPEEALTKPKVYIGMWAHLAK